MTNWIIVRIISTHIKKKKKNKANHRKLSWRGEKRQNTIPALEGLNFSGLTGDFFFNLFLDLKWWVRNLLEFLRLIQHFTVYKYDHLPHLFYPRLKKECLVQVWLLSSCMTLIFLFSTFFEVWFSCLLLWE